MAMLYHFTRYRFHWAIVYFCFLTQSLDGEQLIGGAYGSHLSPRLSSGFHLREAGLLTQRPPPPHLERLFKKGCIEQGQHHVLRV